MVSLQCTTENAVQRLKSKLKGVEARNDGVPAENGDRRLASGTSHGPLRNERH
jgi:hypothetical protein